MRGLLQIVESRFVRTYRPFFGRLGKDPFPIISNVLLGEVVVPARRIFIDISIAPDARIRFRESFDFPPPEATFLDRNPRLRNRSTDFPHQALRNQTLVRRFGSPFFPSSLSVNSVSRRASRPWRSPRDISLKRRSVRTSAKREL